jgi:serine/threonine protein kinase
MENLIIGTNYLHSLELVHCDLKPDNIMVNTNYYR